MHYGHILLLELKWTSAFLHCRLIAPRWWHCDRWWGRIPQARRPQGARRWLTAQQSVPGWHELPSVQSGGRKIRQVFAKLTFTFTSMHNTSFRHFFPFFFFLLVFRDKVSLCSLGKLPTCNLPLPTKCCITVLLECKILGTSHPLHSYNYPSGKQYDSHFTPKTARLRAVEETAGVHTFANIKPWKVTVIHTSVFLTTESMTSAASDVCPHTFLP